MNGVMALSKMPVFKARLHCTIETIAPAWRLLEQEGVVSAYQRLDWVVPMLAHVARPAKASPLFVEVMEEISGSPVMIVPLAMIRRRGYRMITWFDLGLCDYAAPLVVKTIDFTPAVMMAAWSAVRGVLPRADLIRISRIPEMIDGHRNPIASLAGCRQMQMQASGVAIGGEADTLLQRLCRPSTLRDMGKQRRRLARAGAIRFTVAKTPEKVETLFSVLVEQRRRRFADLGRFDLLARPEIQAFYEEAALDSLSTGPVRLFGLSVGTAWIAAAYGLLQGGTFHGILLTTSDDPEWRKASPGLQIVSDCMRWARLEGVNYFDFTVGDLPYKRDFGVETRRLDEAVSALTLKGWGIVSAERLGQAAMTRLRRYPAVYKASQAARRGLRRLGNGCLEASRRRQAMSPRRPIVDDPVSIGKIAPDMKGFGS